MPLPSRFTLIVLSFQVSPMVKQLWEAFSQVLRLNQLSSPVAEDKSLLMDFEQFRRMAQDNAKWHTKLNWLFHLCYPTERYAAYLHVGADHNPVFYAFHGTLHGKNQAQLESLHVITREQQKNTFAKSAEEVLKQELRRLYLKVESMLPDDVVERASEYADLCDVLRRAQKNVLSIAS